MFKSICPFLGAGESHADYSVNFILRAESEKSPCRVLMHMAADYELLLLLLKGGDFPC